MNKEKAIKTMRDVIADSHPHLKEKIYSFGTDQALGLELDNFDVSAFCTALKNKTSMTFIMSYCDSLDDVYMNHEPLFREYTE